MTDLPLVLTSDEYEKIKVLWTTAGFVAHATTIALAVVALWIISTVRARSPVEAHPLSASSQAAREHRTHM